MKSKSIRRARGLRTALFLAAGISASHAQVTVDGVLDVLDGYTENAVQATASGWGAENYLAKLATVQDGSHLAVFLAGKPQNNAFILFIDSKAGGPSTISNTQITSGGEEYTINNLGPSGTDTGMTFETGFNPDYAIRVFGSGDGTQAYVNFYNLQTGTRGYYGQIVAANNAANGFIAEDARALWTNLAAPYTGATQGAEFRLSLAGLGVPTGTGVPIKLMAVLVNGGSDYASNQVLGSRTTPNGDIGGDINNINFETVDGTQTITITVDNVDTDGDGDPDDVDTDDDNDGLLDVHETNDGIYDSATDTGTNPKIADTDSDSFSDGDEVNATLGYVSNPNFPNYTSMAVPGNYTTPTWQPDGSAGNSMTQGNTASLTEQYVWRLNYDFGTRGPIEYKYAANGSWAVNWGNGGNNINANINATGFHTFTFNNATLAQSLVRTVFPDVAAFLAAYGLTAGSDSDSDGVANENEFAANSDPTTADTDGDGLLDGADPQPLIAGGYVGWAAANAGGQAADLDFDGDGVPNGVEFFMGETGSSFTATPGVIANVVTWPKSDTYTGTYGVNFLVQTSGNLTDWTDILITDPNLNNGDPLQYTLPSGTGPLFVRLKVVAP